MCISCCEYWLKRLFVPYCTHAQVEGQRSLCSKVGVEIDEGNFITSRANVVGKRQRYHIHCHHIALSVN